MCAFSHTGLRAAVAILTIRGSHVRSAMTLTPNCRRMWKRTIRNARLAIFPGVKTFTQGPVQWRREFALPAIWRASRFQEHFVLLLTTESASLVQTNGIRFDSVMERG